MKKHSALLVTLLFSTFAVSTALAVPITVTKNYINAFTYDDTSSTNRQDYIGTTIPWSQTLTSNSGKSSNTTNINYSGSANSAELSVSMQHSIDNSAGIIGGGCCDYAFTGNDSLYFTANSNSIYSISGFYDTLSTAGTLTTLDVYLYNLTTGDMLFREMSHSEDIINESFVLDGVGEGNISNIISGSLTGNLIAGNNYKFYFHSYIQSRTGSNETTAMASANGNVTLAISTPEPSLLALMVIGLLAMGMIRKRV